MDQVSERAPAKVRKNAIDESRIRRRGSVRYVTVQQIAGPRVAQQDEDRGRHRHHENEKNPCAGHPVVLSRQRDRV